VAGKYKIDEVKQMMKDMLITKDGETPNVDYLVDMIESCSKDDNRKRRRDGLKKLKELGKGKKRFTKEKEGRLFGMIYEYDTSDKNMSLEEEGLYARLRKNIQFDGTNLVVIEGVHNRVALAKAFGISKNKISGLLNSLETKNLIKVVQLGKSIDIYINPYYYRVTRWASDKVIEIFNLPDGLFES